MKTRTKVHGVLGSTKGFYEEGTLRFAGKDFTSGGSYLGKDKKTGKLGGVLYANEKGGYVNSWDGKFKIPAHFGYEYQSNMGDVRQHVDFKIGNHDFTGTYYKSGSNIVRFREKLKKVGV
jgi:hypothetical protein